MKIRAGFFVAFWVVSNLSAQTLAPSPKAPSSAAQLEILTKKIDEQNLKIDTLSQQILKLEQQIANTANTRPGVMIGETPTPSPVTTAPSTASSTPSTNGGNTHTVARGETLTSIAKVYGVTVIDLQKYNHIENPLKLQAGQTLIIPASPAPSPSPSPSPNS